MKQRITYLLPGGSGLSASDIEVQNDSLTFAKAGQAVEEWKFTLALEELPDELVEILQDTHELHIRWTSEQNARFVPPFVSRLPAGSHVFFTPRADAVVPLCPLLDRLLGSEGKAKCTSLLESFSKPPILSGRFASTATWQWFQLAPIQDDLGRWILGKVCGEDVECGGRLGEVATASYVDVDFDAIGRVLTVTGVWSPFRRGYDGSASDKGDVRTIRKVKEGDRVEVGTLQAEESEAVEELSLSGFLTVIGEDHRPSATAFSFPSRHHPLPANARSSYRASFQQPTGLHPKLEFTLSRRNLKPPKDSCALHAYWTLPSVLFIDRYQFSDALFLASQNLVALRSLSGEEDLEAPDWVIKRWGSAALFELAHPLVSTGDETDLVVTIPTHLRYLANPLLPTDPLDKATLEVPWPTVFWACEAEEGLKMSNNPFDRINLGFDGLFGPKTMFYHIPPVSDAERLVAEVKVPVLDPGSAVFVRLGTAVAVLVGFGWVCWKMVRGSMSAGSGEGKEGGKGKKVR